MKNFLQTLLLAIGLAGAAHSPAALLPGQVNDDTDLFLIKPSAAAGLPNVLIIWDNTANWGQNVAGNTAYQLEKDALSAVISGLVNADGTAKVNVGLMLFTETGGGNDNVRGTYIRSRLRAMDKANSDDLAGLIAKLDTINDRGSNAQYAKAMHEAFQYYGGRDALAGAGQLKRDCLAFIQPTGPSILGPFAKSFNLTCTPHRTTYFSPVSDGCQKNFIILISNGTTDNGENNEAQKLLTGLGGVNLKTDPLPLVPNNEAANWSDEYARFMRGNDFCDAARFGGTCNIAGPQNITTYTIAVYDKSEENNAKGPTPSQIALARSTADRGGGKFFAGTDLDSLKNALDQIFAEVQSVNTVFASVTLPVSVNPTSRGTNLNQVYMGLFRPDANLAPRWFGNLKLYTIARDSNGVQILVDAQSPPQSAVGPTGFMRPTAVSHWTTSSTFWGFRSDAENGAGGASDLPDGDIVEKGSVAEMLRNTYATDQSARKLYTCIGCGTGTDLSDTSSTATKFADANGLILTGDLGAADAAERTAIINWVRGQDNKVNENNNQNADATPNLTDARASIHGDVLHSRPAVVNYNRFGDDNDVYVFYGSNGDGVFRAIKGGMGGGAGAEQWGFIPPELFPKLRRLRENSPLIDFATKRPYFMDGPIGIYTSDANGNNQLNPGTADKVHLFIGTRRGGRFIYALDVSDPVAPRFMWKRANTDTGFAELGYTWSEPKVVKMKGRADPVLVMGLGYDPNVEDNDPATPPPAAGQEMGRGIIVLDAFTGDIIWQAGAHVATSATSVNVAGMTRSIPSDVTALDRDGDGTIDRLYVGDTGGNLWRVDINVGAGDTFDPSLWAVNKLATIGGTGADERKFLFPPDVVLPPHVNGGNFDAVLIGTGDREHPFNTTVTNRFYMFKDVNQGPLTTSDTLVPITDADTDLFDATLNTVQVGTDTVAAQLDLANKKGWKLTLAVGEKVISSSVTLGGATFFNTNIPVSELAPGTCSNLGEAREYAVNYEDASAIIDLGATGLTTSDRYRVNPAGGYLPSPTPYIVDGTPGVGSGPSLWEPPSTPVGARYRTYWYMRTD